MTLLKSFGVERDRAPFRCKTLATTILAALTLVLTTLVAHAQSDVERASLDALDFPILFTKQHNYQGLHIYDTYFQYRPGGGIYVLENPSAPPEERRVRAVIDATTPETLGEGVYATPALSYDAKKIVFSFKGAPDGNTCLYEIGVDGKGLRQVTDFNFQPNPYFGSGKGWHDVQPAYLPDGRIIFSSTRYSELVPCANNGVAILCVVNPDGSDLHTISVNNVTDFNPNVMDDGRVVFGRWEYIDKNALTIQSLWTIYPDGTNETALFANNMVFPEAVLQARQVPDMPELVVCTLTGHNCPPRGAIAMIDVSGDKDDENAIFNFEYHDCPSFDRGQSCDPWALNENVVLYSGMISDPLPTSLPTDPGQPQRINAVLPQPKGVYNSLLLIDREGNRVEVLHDDSIDLHSPIPLLPRQAPRVAAEMIDRTQDVGRFFVNDVYEGLGEVERGAVKWLRVVEETARTTASPGSNGLNQTFSVSAAMAWSAKNYLGYAPVKEDGSVYFEVPSGRAVYFQLLDENFRLIRSMRTFVKAAQGVTRSCVGCHEYGPPTLTDAGATRYPKDAVEKLRVEPWGGGYLDYPSHIQPIWDAKCVRCHGGDELAAGLDLSGAPTRIFNISYENLTSRRRNQYQIDLIAGICCMNGTAHYSCKFFEPYEHGSGKAPLAELLMNDPIHRDLLTKEERELVFTWIDSNAIYYGTWDYTDCGPILKPIEEAKARLIEVMKEPQSGCAECHTDGSGAVRRFENDWINIAQPEASRILRAPLAKSEQASGNGSGLALCRRRAFDQNFLRLGVMSNGQYEHAVKELRMFPTQEWQEWDESGEPVVSFESTDDPTYRKMLAIVMNARSKAIANPRIDMANAYDAPNGIHEGRSRQILPLAVPEQPLPLDAQVAADGVVALRWERSARTIGLVFEVWRGTSAERSLDDSTLLVTTERFDFVDKTAPSGNVWYALVPISDPKRTCGTYRVSAENAASDRFESTRGETSFASVVVPDALTPQAPQNAVVTSELERTFVQWRDPDGVDSASIRYSVYRQRADHSDAKATLTPAPIVGNFFYDETLESGVDYRYEIVAVSRRGVVSEPVVAVGRATPAPKLTLLSAPFEKELTASIDVANADNVATPDVLGAPKLDDNAVTFASGDWLVYPYAPEFNVKRRMTLELDVFFKEPGTMPIVVGFGNWRQSGWFLQKLTGKWRFHYAGVDCDSTEPVPIGKWLHVVATYDGQKLQIVQDGKVVAQTPCANALNDWSKGLFVGQYSATQDAVYQFVGSIRNLKLLNYVEK